MNQSFGDELLLEQIKIRLWDGGAGIQALELECVADRSIQSRSDVKIIKMVLRWDYACECENKRPGCGDHLWELVQEL
jgi:hypothetical protein